ncbi:MAG TPA: nuclear transport factor 2 family protein [Vicinamibacterales bacterium]|nr:nuclear transport factor 2 family protein [Vicinamibacterales bacterium]
MRAKLAVCRGGYLFVVLACGVVSVGATSWDASSSQAAASDQARQGSAEPQIKAAHEQLLEAARKDDKATARRMMDDGLSWVHASGRIASKDELLGTTPAPPPDVKVERVQLLGNAAIVTGSSRYEDGRQARFLQQWVNRDGQWKLLAHQGTPIGGMPAAGQARATPSAEGTAGRATMKGSAPALASDEERAVWKADTQLRDAFLTGDVAAYEKLTSDDFVRIGPGGERQDKAEFLQTVKRNAGQSAGRIETGEVSVGVSGDVARVVMTTWGAMPGGDEFAPLRITKVLVKRNGQWQQAGVIFTPVTNQK